MNGLRLGTLWLSLVLAAAGLARATDDTKFAPPAGITPSTAVLSQILKAHADAVGRLAPGVPDTRSEAWRFNKAGLAGTETLLRRDTEYRSRIVTGPIVQEYGQFLGRRWHRDANGLVTRVLYDDVTTFEVTRVLEDAADPKNDVKLLGEITDPQPAYVVEVKRPGFKHPEWVFYDKRTSLVDRVVQIVRNERITSTYSDYRKTKGLTEPWHLHDSNGQAVLDDDYVRTSLMIGETLDLRQFTTPQSESTLDQFSGHVVIPGKIAFSDGAVYVSFGRYHTLQTPTAVVRLVVNGRGLDFELSSGSPTSLIDEDVARELGLSSYGQVTRTPDGKELGFMTVIPSAQAGGLTLHNFAVLATPFHYHVNGETKIVGTLGYDVLAGGVFKVDFIKGTIELDPASTFDSPMPVPDSYFFPLQFYGGYAFFHGIIDSHPSDSLLFDTAFDMSFVCGNYIQHYPNSVQDALSGRTHSTVTVPFADDRGYGKNVDIWVGKVPDIQFGYTNFADLVMLATDGDVDMGGHRIDAIMGADILQYYDMYLDYPHERAFLKPNQKFFDVFHLKG